MVLKMGTKMSPPTPRKKIILRCPAVSPSDASVTAVSCGAARLPFSDSERIYAGITIDTSEGMNISMMTPAAVMTPLFHSMMVVTSPMGENAPPELAEMTTNAA